LMPMKDWQKNSLSPFYPHAPHFTLLGPRSHSDSCISDIPFPPAGQFISPVMNIDREEIRHLHIIFNYKNIRSGSDIVPSYIVHIQLMILFVSAIFRKDLRIMLNGISGGCE
jgi:hypothetical protein